MSTADMAKVKLLLRKGNNQLFAKENRVSSIGLPGKQTQNIFLVFQYMKYCTI